MKSYDDSKKEKKKKRKKNEKNTKKKATRKMKAPSPAAVPWVAFSRMEPRVLSKAPSVQL